MIAVSTKIVFSSIIRSCVLVILFLFGFSIVEYIDCGILKITVKRTKFNKEMQFRCMVSFELSEEKVSARLFYWLLPQMVISKALLIKKSIKLGQKCKGSVT